MKKFLIAALGFSIALNAVADSAQITRLTQLGMPAERSKEIDGAYSSAVKVSTLPKVTNSISLGSATKTYKVVYSTVFSAGAASTLTATGTNQATGLVLTTSVNNFTTVAASTAAVLPATTVCPIGCHAVVRNGGANDLLLYPATGQGINGGAANASITLTTAAKQVATCDLVTATLWVCTVATGT